MEVEYNKEKIIYSSNGKVIKEVDLTPVNRIKKNLEKILNHRKNNQDRSHVEYSVEIMKEIRTLTKDQLEYLSNAFVGLMIKYADSLQRIYDNPEEESKKIRKYKNFHELIKSTG